MNDQCNSKMDNQLWNDSIISQSPVKNTSVILQKQDTPYYTEPRNEGQKVLMLYHNYELTSLIYINLIYE